MDFEGVSVCDTPPVLGLSLVISWNCCFWLIWDSNSKFASPLLEIVVFSAESESLLCSPLLDFELSYMQIYVFKFYILTIQKNICKVVFTVVVELKLLVSAYIMIYSDCHTDNESSNIGVSGIKLEADRYVIILNATNKTLNKKYNGLFRLSHR